MKQERKKLREILGLKKSKDSGLKEPIGYEKNIEGLLQYLNDISEPNNFKPLYYGKNKVYKPLLWKGVIITNQDIDLDFIQNSILHNTWMMIYQDLPLEEFNNRIEKSIFDSYNIFDSNGRFTEYSIEYFDMNLHIKTKLEVFDSIEKNSLQIEFPENWKPSTKPYKNEHTNIIINL